ncbi:MAG: tyrosine--tRNA ligase, partial [Chloroflexi bacterium]|nr:tyrosine--tRNA ligase [Chloroflexota bacterium]
FVAAGLCESRNAARRLIEQGGATVDGKKVGSIDDPVDPAALREGLLLRAGKKRFVRVVLG